MKKIYNKKRLWLIIIILSILLIIYSLINIVNWVIDNKNTSKISSEAKKKVKIVKKKSKQEDKKVNEEKVKVFDPYWDFMTLDYNEVDLSELIKENNEVVSWITVKGTNINYPVLQHIDNDFYLTHSFDKSNNEAGWVFMDYRNNPLDFERNTIIYAHARKNGAMFGTLKNILKSDWYNNSNNYVVNLSTLNQNSIWQVFSVYKIPTTNDYIQTDFPSSESFLNFINKIKDRSLYDFKTTISENDRVLTLSTCYKDNEKVVLHAKLIKSQKK